MFNSHNFDVLGSTLASTLRRWRGTMGSSKTAQPEKAPELFDREGCPHCRLVREALTELNLDAMIYPVPQGGVRHRQRLQELSGGDTVPFLYDPNTDEKIAGAQAIVTYLFRQYRAKQPPAALRESFINMTGSRLATLVRGGKGLTAAPSNAPKKPLALYSFESSPFSRLVRERLCELELPYLLVNLSKQQLADLGPAAQRLHLGDYKPLPGSKREAFLKEHGRVQAPFLVDPNRGEGAGLFESAEIIKYLNAAYAV
ncbi:hypothetical protein EUZ85_03080 [Hahella sp. KA22]|uniref:glutathione S-transferase N-terminal domain-containing protein n=1 Tax=Hahella sp. KA22 TaxID=1628392 RepID=UPI000FDE1661|nr:glutathione S-transferase N-terminal domain-containing protein [Hahella sp. KA22]AZZ89744.1 hypothetical protein ENC22_00535 [Hahella sp. KA22]QAY53114.1 hypothetical protein EUZ85_03080 [Hahella sp. KA22]